jgi:hypothetical protein
LGAATFFFGFGFGLALGASLILGAGLAFGCGLADLRGAALAFDGFAADFLAAFFTGFLAAFRGLSPTNGAI